MSLKLHMYNTSPPSRTVLITANAVGIEVELHVMTKAEELHTPEYLKINPAHTAPVLVDNGKTICDSHAIAAYLVEKYGKDSSLYPKDVYQRAKVDEKLYFDTGVLFPALKSAFMGIMKKEYKEIPQSKIEAIRDAYNILDKFLDKKQWLAGANPTIADISCATTTISLTVALPIDPKLLPNLHAWLDRVQSLSYFKEDDKYCKYFENFIKELLNW